MSEWSRVRWTEAGQVNALLDGGGEPGEPSATPVAHFDMLRQTGRRQAAVFFLGQALPRLEAVAWAARIVRDMMDGGDHDPAESRVLRAALLWVQDPSEGRRWTAFEAAQEVEVGSPARMAALAAFFSGGSIAPPSVAPVLAPQGATGTFAAGAVLAAASRGADRDKGLDAALDAGDALARQGLQGAGG